MILVHIFLWGKDRNDTLGYANVIVKQKKKLSEQKRVDLMHILIGISFFLIKPGLPYAECLYSPSTT